MPKQSGNSENSDEVSLKTDEQFQSEITTNNRENTSLKVDQITMVSTEKISESLHKENPTSEQPSIFQELSLPPSLKAKLNTDLGYAKHMVEYDGSPIQSDDVIASLGESSQQGVVCLPSELSSLESEAEDLIEETKNTEEVKEKLASDISRFEAETSLKETTKDSKFNQYIVLVTIF